MLENLIFWGLVLATLVVIGMILRELYLIDRILLSSI
jgi:hypothetical protein